MKKHLSFLLAAVMLLSLTACGNQSSAEYTPTTIDSTGLVALAAAADGTTTGFTDVPETADYAAAVEWCYSEGLMNGTSDVTFAPDSTLTRSMMATVLYRAAGSPAVSGAPSFTDTEANTWYSDAVVWANDQGILQGYGNHIFGINDPVSVEQLQVILDRYLGKGNTWVGNPARAIPATRAQIAVALCENLKKSEVNDVNGTPVILEMNGREVHATLNNTTTAKALLELLPYSVRVSRAADDLCGSVSENLPSVASEGQSAWHIGEIGWFGGWFTILCDHEENFSNMPGVMIIGKIAPADLGYVTGLRGSVDITVRRAEDTSVESVTNKLNVTFNSHTYTATLAENSSVDAFVAYLRERGGSIIINAHDYGSFEKVGALGTSIVQNNTQITTVPGDIILYQGNSIVLYYAQNSWSFTRLGKLDSDLSNLKADLGDGDVSITYALS